MSDAKHTPGPWFTNRQGRSTVYIEAPIRDGWLQEVAACGPTEAGQEQQEANARLIAAAPELLAALQAALAVIDDYLEYEHNGDPWTEDARAMGEMDIDDYQCDGRLEAAREAIAKATGGAA